VQERQSLLKRFQSVGDGCRVLLIEVDRLLRPVTQFSHLVQPHVGRIGFETVGLPRLLLRQGGDVAVERANLVGEETSSVLNPRQGSSAGLGVQASLSQRRHGYPGGLEVTLVLLELGGLLLGLPLRARCCQSQVGVERFLGIDCLAQTGDAGVLLRRKRSSPSGTKGKRDKGGREEAAWNHALAPSLSFMWAGLRWAPAA
jgi:hypothetical protein